jgi:hypothetical protein
VLLGGGGNEQVDQPKKASLTQNVDRRGNVPPVGMILLVAASDEILLGHPYEEETPRHLSVDQGVKYS